MLKRLMCFVAALFVGSSASAQSTTEPKMNLAEIREKAKKKEAVIIDVRERAEWDEGHLKQAKLIPLSALRDHQHAELIKDLDKDVPIFCHCKAGVRAQYAAEIFENLGFKSYAIEDSYEQIVASGFEEVKP